MNIKSPKNKKKEKIECRVNEILDRVKKPTKDDESLADIVYLERYFAMEFLRRNMFYINEYYGKYKKDEQKYLNTYYYIPPGAKSKNDYKELVDPKRRVKPDDPYSYTDKFEVRNVDDFRKTFNIKDNADKIIVLPAKRIIDWSIIQKLFDPTDYIDPVCVAHPFFCFKNTVVDINVMARMNEKELGVKKEVTYQDILDESEQDPYILLLKVDIRDSYKSLEKQFKKWVEIKSDKRFISLPTHKRNMFKEWKDQLEVWDWRKNKQKLSLTKIADIQKKSVDTVKKRFYLAYEKIYNKKYIAEDFKNLRNIPKLKEFMESICKKCSDDKCPMKNKSKHSFTAENIYEVDNMIKDSVCSELIDFIGDDRDKTRNFIRLGGLKKSKDEDNEKTKIEIPDNEIPDANEKAQMKSDFRLAIKKANFNDCENEIVEKILYSEGPLNDRQKKDIGEKYKKTPEEIEQIWLKIREKLMELLEPYKD